LFIENNGVPVPLLLQDNGTQVNYWTPEQIFAMAFNRGNDSNTTALLEGFDGLTLAQVDSLLDIYLTKEDVRAVQNIIDSFEEMRPETEEVHLRIKNYPMERIEARPWTFKGETFKGGYYPLAIDRNLANKEHGFFPTKKAETDFFEKEDKAFVVPYAKATHTLKR
jgi:hypothetical protein